MVFLAWLLVLVPASFALWCLAAFVFRAGKTARAIAAVVIPAMGVGLFLYADYWSTRTPPAEPGWDIFNALFCLVAGAFTIIATGPVLLLAERFLGKRAH